MTETTTETVRRLMAVVGRVKLDASPDFWKAPMSTLVECYNGTGPEWFPQGLRHVLDEVLELALPAVLIHDFDYSYNDGSNSKYLTSNPAQYLILDSDGSFGFATAPTGTVGNNITFSTKVKIDNSGNIYGVSGTTGMNSGFIYVPSASGAPSGTPTSISGHCPIYVDESNNRIYVRIGSSWKYASLT